MIHNNTIILEADIHRHRNYLNRYMEYLDSIVKSLEEGQFEIDFYDLPMNRSWVNIVLENIELEELTLKEYKEEKERMERSTILRNTAR